VAVGSYVIILEVFDVLQDSRRHDYYALQLCSHRDFDLDNQFCLRLPQVVINHLPQL
jgi:hypothetical protein